MALHILPMLGGMAARAAIGAAGQAAVGAARTGAVAIRGAGRTAFGAMRRRGMKRMLRRKRRGQTIAQFTGKRFRANSPTGRDVSRSLQRRLNRIDRGQQGTSQQGGGGGRGGQDDERNREHSSLGAFGRAVKAATQSLVAFAIAIPGAVKAIQALGSIVVDSQRGTARYSGTMSLAAAKLDIGRIGRDMQTAQATSGSFTRLTQSLDKLENAMQPFREAMTNFLNNGLAELLNLTTSFVNLVKPLAPVIDYTGKAIENLAVGIQAMWEGKTMGQVRAERDADARKAQDAFNARGLQNFSDLMSLRANVAAANGVNKPNPRIPAGPVKGGKPGNPANPAPPPAVLRVGI